MGRQRNDHGLEAQVLLHSHVLPQTPSPGEFDLEMESGRGTSRWLQRSEAGNRSVIEYLSPEIVINSTRQPGMLQDQKEEPSRGSDPAGRTLSRTHSQLNRSAVGPPGIGGPMEYSGCYWISI